MVPGSVNLVIDKLKKCKDLWLPVMLKATAGGGGKGMRALEKKIIKAWEGARQESAAALGMTVCILKIN
jgi:acetyl-CoA carboxylase biotin carboxylase subunit